MIPAVRLLPGASRMLLCAFAISASPHVNACEKWDVSGQWAAVQSNDTNANLSLQQSGKSLQGTGVYYYVPSSSCIAFCEGEDPVQVNASVDGTLDGDAIAFTAYWSNDTIGVYTGKIGPQGRIEGISYDRQHPKTIASWYSSRTATCLDDTQTGMALGRVPGTHPAPPVTVGNEPQICAIARDARARNSPVAPRLEDQCRLAQARVTTSTTHDTTAEPATPLQGGFKAIARQRAIALPAAVPPAVPAPAAPVLAPDDLIVGRMVYEQNGVNVRSIQTGIAVTIRCTYVVNGNNSFVRHIQPWQGSIVVGGQAPQTFAFQGKIDAGNHDASVTWMPTAIGPTPITCLVNPAFSASEAQAGNNQWTDVLTVSDAAAVQP
jgi:hypothetical protein